MVTEYLPLLCMMPMVLQVSSCGIFRGGLYGSATFSYPQISGSQKNFTEETQQTGNQRKHGQNEKQRNGAGWIHACHRTHKKGGNHDTDKESRHRAQADGPMYPSRSASKHRHFLFLRGFYLIVQIAQHPGPVHDAGKTIGDHVEYRAYACQQEDWSNGHLYDMGNSRNVGCALHCSTSIWNSHYNGTDKNTGRITALYLFRQTG
jgi:hypothetical protein